MVWFIFVLNALAVHRLTVLVYEDKITEPIRDRFYKRWNPAETWTYLFTCPWCISIWVAAIAVAGTLLIPIIWLPLAALLALSSITGLIESKR
jgi:hypothetical protein